MERIGHTFGIYEIFSYLSPGILVLSSIYLYFWPNPSATMLNSHLELVGHLSFTILFILIAYVIGLILEPINTFVFFHIIYPILGNPSDRLLKNKYYYPISRNEIKQDGKLKYDFGFKLKRMLEKKYGTELDIWQYFRHCESEVRAIYPQNAQIAARYDALAIMCRSMALALFLLLLVIIRNILSSRSILSMENGFLVVVSIFCTIILVFRGARYSYWAMREILNTFYFMNYNKNK